MDLPSPLELGLRLLLAALLGALVGLEREISDHPAGLRTHLTVALGAALFAVAGAYGLREFESSGADGGTYQVDVTRIPSNIVSGIGFLGGGAILKYGASVKGLTTAASLWVVAAVGMTVAFGEYALGVAASAVLLVSLIGLRGPVRWIERHVTNGGRRVLLELAPDGDLSSVLEAVNAIEELELRGLRVTQGEEGGRALHLDLAGPRSAAVERQIANLGAHPDVISVDSL